MYELPPVNRYEQYVHRVGRVGRTGTVGCAFIFFDISNPNDIQIAEFLKDVCFSSFFSNKKIEFQQLLKVHQKVPEWLDEIVRDQYKWELAFRQQNNVGNGLKRTGPIGEVRSRMDMDKNLLANFQELDEDKNDFGDDEFSNSGWV